MKIKLYEGWRPVHFVAHILSIAALIIPAILWGLEGYTAGIIIAGCLCGIIRNDDVSEVAAFIVPFVALYLIGAGGSLAEIIGIWGSGVLAFAFARIIHAFLWLLWCKFDCFFREVW